MCIYIIKEMFIIWDRKAKRYGSVICFLQMATLHYYSPYVKFRRY